MKKVKNKVAIFREKKKSHNILGGKRFCENFENKCVKFQRKKKMKR